MLTGDTNPVRRIQGIKHIDPYAAFENDTPEFRAAVHEEGERWSKAPKPDYAAWHEDYTTILDKALPVEENYAQVRDGAVSIQYSYSHRKNVWIHGALTFKDITEFLRTDDEYAVITDVGDGAELYELTVYNKQLTKLWGRQPVGPTAAFHANTIYYQTPVKRLRYNKVKAANATTGKQERTIYIETNPKFNTEILQPPFQEDVFIKSANALDQKLDIIVGNTVKRIKHDNSTLIPLSATHYLTNTRLEPIAKLPHGHYAVNGIMYKGTPYIITVSKGHHTLWRYTKEWEELKQAPVIRFLSEAVTPTVQCAYHYKPSEVYEILTEKRTKMPILLSLSHMEGTANHVPYTIVYKENTRPAGLLVSAYGAYGIESQREYPVRWLPWIQRGYAFAVAMPRGGRDDGDAWYDEGRTALKKHHTFEDTAAVIKAVQTRLRISPQRTVFYGRSAGGWVAAMMALQYSDRVAAVIAEVPYVDVLRTTSNPRLPLTTLEYDEFGDPIHKKSDYTALLKISPVDIAKTLPSQTTTVLLKTALHDSEVAAYESLKLAASLREKGWGHVYVNIDGEGGHFVGRNKMASQYAEDAAFLQSSLSRGFASASRRTRKLASHVSKGTTRRVKSSSKHVMSKETSPDAV